MERKVGRFMSDEEYATFESVAVLNGIDIYAEEANEYGSVQMMAAYWFSLGYASKDKKNEKAD